MKYKKPVCECGNDLQITAVMTCDRMYRIEENGSKSPSPMFSPECIDGEHLECTECGRAYEIEFDNKDRYIRGETYQC